MKSKIILIIVAILAIIGFGYAFIASKNQTAVIPIVQNPVTTPVDNTKVTNKTSNPISQVSHSEYKDGTYSAPGDYVSPGGYEEIGVTVTLKNDIVTSAEVSSNMASGGTAERFQSVFIQNFQSQVIGKNINDVMLDRVSGSSLTPQGWNDAISKIETQAKA